MKTIAENTTKNTHNVVYQLLLENQDCRTVLDIPCGAGAFTQRLLQHKFVVYASDIENILQCPNPLFQPADMNQPLPFAPDFFDAVVSIDGIEHIERPFDFVRECHRILKTGGQLIISTPNISSLRSRWRWFLTGHHNKCRTPLDECHPNPLHHISMISYPEIRYLLHSNGFQITTITTNRIKPVSYLYIPCLPFSYLATRVVYRKHERDPDQKIRNQEILRQMFSTPVLFGETLIVKAVCRK
ncbi:MAG TPA: methyltransferase domain-containing protein [bacterium]|nr:methyltransferase domain-containing protein [bacterium]HOL95770.1 methyltransferase domain-containing protein [bacterium]